MDDKFNSLRELEELFYDLTVSLIGGSPEPEVRQSWPTQGQPGFTVEDNVAFLKIYDIPSAITEQQETKFEYMESPEYYNEKISYTRTLNISWIIYGPSSWEWATKIRYGIYYQEAHDLLARNNIYIVPSFDPPRRVPEIWAGLWYERCDLEISFNELIQINRESHYVEKVPVVVVDENNIRTEIIINK